MTFSNKNISSQELEVRLILPSEKPKWTSLMAQHHYLNFTRLIGESLYYIATIDGEWVALIGWSSPALHCKARDNWIGWSSQVKPQRLHLVVNNTRFLILPWVHLKNLASKILSLNVKRLSRDWLLRHGHPVILAETFVDPRRFPGTCYKASNWQHIGKTEGFRKSAKKYIYHGECKLVFVKELEKRACKKLTCILLENRLREKSMSISVPFTSKQLEALNNTLSILPDSRKVKGIRHRYRAIIAIAICAVLSSAKSFIEIGEWASSLNQNQLKRFKTYYDRKKRAFVPPSESCIRRTLQASSAETIDGLLGDWLANFVTNDDASAIAVDGKVLKGAKDEQGNQTQLLSAFLHQEGISLKQISIDNKTNEIPELPRLLENIQIEGKVITADALHTQVETANFLIKKKPTMSLQ